MMPYRILVVDDDPTARKLLRMMLQGAGAYAVLEAPDGRAALEVVKNHTVDLVLLDLVLPDVPGAELIKQLRALPDGAALPVIAVSALLSATDEGGTAAAGFSGHLPKPIDSGRLLRLVRSFLPDPIAAAGAPGRSRSVLVVDDDPVQRKILAMRLTGLEFRVTTAGDGVEALELARTSPPDAIVSDALMPRMDGFGLCIEVRHDPRLAGVPVVLFSSHYLEEADDQLGRRVGASAYVVRTPQVGEIVSALLAALDRERSTAPAPDREALSGDHAARVVRQLERQIALSSGLAEQSSLQAKALSVAAVTADVLSRGLAPGSLLERTLAALVEGEVVALAAVYLVEPAGLVLGALVGATAATLGELHGLDRLLAQALEGEELVIVPPDSTPAQAVAELLSALGARTLVLASIAAGPERFGVLLLGLQAARVTEEMTSFVRAIRGQLGQALALGRSLAAREHVALDLRASEARYRLLLEHMPVGIAVHSEGKVVFANPAAARLLGAATPAEVEGRAVSDFSPPERRAAAADRARRLLAGEQGLYPVEDQCVRLDGTRVPVQAIAVPMTFSGKPAIQVIVTDLTDRVRAEAAREKLEDELRMAQKMEAVGRLAGGVAHDFNNLLAVILGNAEFASSTLGEADPLYGDIDEIRKAAEKAAALTRQLLAFSRRQVLRLEVLDLNQIAAELEKMLGRLVGEDIELTSRYAPDLWRVKADPGQLEQVIMNLVVNARDAMPRGGKLSIATANAELDAAYAAEHAEATAGCYVRLTIRDSGSGMAPEVLQHLFEPFFTTKAVGKGTGLGLSTVYGIVKQSGGHLAVHSEPGAGTTFEVYLPRALEEPSSPTPGVAAEATGGAETILVVEDEGAVRKLTERMLRAAGFEVLSAGSGAEALSTCEGYAGDIDLLLTDVVMPKMSGRELADQLRRARPSLRVLYMSGYADDAITDHGVLDPQTKLIGKPFSAAELTHKVREALDEPPGEH
ncbi:MAG: response regulator [Myxococcales bacterium]|nr:response regulator [Myxococcales bacterium]